jgi:hypothetical protein
MATPASVFLSEWREWGIILYEVHPRYHTRDYPIVLGYAHGISRYYHLPADLEQLREDMHLPGPDQSFEAWLNQLGSLKASSDADTDRTSKAPPAPAAPVPADSWDPKAHPPIL